MDPAVATARAQHAARHRHHGPDHPATIAAGRDLRAARLSDYVRRAVDEAPPLTAEQIGELQAILSAAVADA